MFDVQTCQALSQRKHALASGVVSAKARRAWDRSGGDGLRARQLLRQWCRQDQTLREAVVTVFVASLPAPGSVVKRHPDHGEQEGMRIDILF